METLYPSLPAVFMSKSKSQPLVLPSYVNEKLVYLWNTSNEMIFSNNDSDLSGQTLSRRLSKAFVDAINQYDIDLPESISNRICCSCSGVLIPTRTCSTRLRPRNQKSNVNKKRRSQKQSRFANQLIIHCTLCDMSNLLNVGLERKTVQVKKSTQTPSIEKTPTNKTPQKFSFLNSLSKSSASSSQKRSLSENLLSPGVNVEKKQRTSLDGLDFIRLSPNPITPKGTPNNSNTFNLLEMEKRKKSMKKLQRKSLS
mmetsp:Transcript_31534/g.43034  ORF Transcript_31534/g.43034 Transcript_31534/m.43034 type:complete len:255 (+) Transcript_31534:160-924(+)